MLKDRAKLITGEIGKNPFLFGKESTFVTGGGLPGSKRIVQTDQGEQEHSDDEEQEFDEDLED